MGMAKYYDESAQSYLPIKAGAIANGDGSNEYTPNQVKRIDEDLSDLIVKVGAVEKTLDTKVDKVAGKQLSTEDYTTEEKTKLAGVENGANNYKHPATHSANIIVENTERRFVTDLEKADWNSKETPEGAQAKIDLHANDTNNPHRVTASQLGAVTTTTFNSHVNDKVKHITSTERNRWNSQFRSRQIFVQGGQPPSSMAEKGDLWIW